MNTTTQRQIEREAEKDLDAAQDAMEDAEDALGIARRLYLLNSTQYRRALGTFDRARATYADALVNLERTTHDDPDT